jgi:HK97 family phage major capsid protein
MNLEAIIARLKEIRTLLMGEEEVDNIDELETEMRDLNTQKEKIEKRHKMADDLNKDPSLAEKRGKIFATKSQEDIDLKIDERSNKIIIAEKREQRGKDLKGVLGGTAGDRSGVKLRMLALETDEERAVVVGNSNVVLPAAFSDNINDTFNQVSTLIDRVKVMPLMGGESYQVPYVVDYGTGGESTLTADSVTVETKFDFATIIKSLITAYQTWPREITKLANAPYDTFVSNGTTKALRKRMNRQVMFGDGTANNFTGIFNIGATMKALDTANDIELSAIDDTTLDQIVFNYGGDEEVEDMAVLLLNKLTLQEFAEVRTTDGVPFYNITLKGNTGTISKMGGGLSIEFLINSPIPSLAAAKISKSTYFAAYGSLSAYEMAIFSDAEVLRSEDFLFKSRQIAYNAEVYAGGNVTKKDGFLRLITPA